MNLNLILIVVLSSLALGACSRPSEESSLSAIEASDSIPSEVKQLVRAIMTDDSVSFASMVSYPLERPYPLKSINDSVEMKSYYTHLVDDSLRNVVGKSTPKDWSENGWRGWTVRNGRYIWVDEKVYDVGYVSQKERRMREKLMKLDMESLPEDMRKDWVPENCMIDSDDGTIYRIDIDTLEKNNPIYRMSVYTSGSDLHKHPHRMSRGHKRCEGTAEEIIYIFPEKDTGAVVADSLIDEDDPTIYIIEAYSQETGKPRLHHRGRHRDLKRAYWLDLLPADSTSIARPSGK